MRKFISTLGIVFIGQESLRQCRRLSQVVMLHGSASKKRNFLNAWDWNL